MPQQNRDRLGEAGLPRERSNYLAELGVVRLKILGDEQAERVAAQQLQAMAPPQPQAITPTYEAPAVYNEATVPERATAVPTAPTFEARAESLAPVIPLQKGMDTAADQPPNAQQGDAIDDIRARIEQIHAEGLSNAV